MSPSNRPYIVAALLAWGALLPCARAEQSTTAVSTVPEPPAETFRGSTAGFYPLWENTGFIERHREMYLGTNGAHYGIADRAHVGVQPVSFLYRAPNAYFKFSLFQGDRWHVAAQAGAFYLMTEASRAYLSPMYSSRLNNPDFAVILLPASLATTYELSDWLQLHQAATAMGVYSPSGELPKQAYLGYTVVAELKAKQRHSVLGHAGEVGFWRHDFSMVGISYRYHNAWLEFQLGYFYRYRQDGNQSAPLVSLGFLL